MTFGFGDATTRCVGQAGIRDWEERLIHSDCRGVHAYKIDYVNYTWWIIVEKSGLSTEPAANSLFCQGLTARFKKLD
jgi:hypothetical protein